MSKVKTQVGDRARKCPKVTVTVVHWTDRHAAGIKGNEYSVP